MNIYFDTEFTGLYKDTDLISIGMVTDDNKSFYAEFNDYDKDICIKNPWLNENVISHLLITDIENGSGTDLNLADGTHVDMWVKGNKKAVKNAIIDFIYPYHAKDKDDTIQLVSDCSHYDMVLFIDIFGTAFDIPTYVSPVCYDINYDISDFLKMPINKAFDISREVFLSKISGEESISTNKKHNALYDAMIIKGIYDTLRNFK